MREVDQAAGQVRDSAARARYRRYRVPRPYDLHVQRFVVCDEDELYTTVIGSLLAERGLDLVGVASTTPDAVALIEAARPDVVIVDFLLGYNTDFDIVATAIDAGAAVIIFSRSADADLLAAYAVPPTVVYKPDLTELGAVIDRLGEAHDQAAAPDTDRRRRPTRPVGPEPTSLSDAHAFYLALDEATEGDALVSVELGAHLPDEQVVHLAEHVRDGLRDTDRLLVTRSLLRIFLPTAGRDGVPALLTRLRDAGALPPGATTKWVGLQPGDTGADAFERLKTAPAS